MKTLSRSANPLPQAEHACPWIGCSHFCYHNDRIWLVFRSHYRHHFDNCITYPIPFHLHREAAGMRPCVSYRSDFYSVSIHGEWARVRPRLQVSFFFSLSFREWREGKGEGGWHGGGRHCLQVDFRIRITRPIFHHGNPTRRKAR